MLSKNSQGYEENYSCRSKAWEPHKAPRLADYHA
jgi:hypothetical protein